METNVASGYRIRLRSLQWSTGLVKELRHSSDAEAVAVAVNWALDAVYDLFEAYKLCSGFAGRMVDENKVLSDRPGSTVGGLLFIRGEKTHQGRRADGRSGFLELPYDFARITDWVWAEAPATDPRYELRVDWYEAHVRHRPLWVPLDEASYWFLTNLPIPVEHQGPRDVDEWVDGVRPIYANDL